MIKRLSSMYTRGCARIVKTNGLKAQQGAAAAT